MSQLSLSAIRECSDRNVLEAKFKEHRVSKTQRIKLLVEAMGNPAISYTCGFPSVKERYELIISSFVAGTWKPSFIDFKTLKSIGY